MIVGFDLVGDEGREVRPAHRETWRPGLGEAMAFERDAERVPDPAVRAVRPEEDGRRYHFPVRRRCQRCARRRRVRPQRRLFAESGFERTTIRAVAAAARSNPGLVIRYYGSEEGLFAADARFDLRLPDLSAVPREAIGKRLVAHFLSRWEDTEAGDELPALIRLAVSHDGARAKLLEMFQGQVAPAVAGLCPPERAAQAAALVGSRFAGLAVTRYVLRIPPIVALDAKTIIERIGATIPAYLDA